MSYIKFEKEASVGSRWWRDNIGFYENQNGFGIFEPMFMYGDSESVSVTELQKDAFELYLKERMIQELNESGSLYLTVDYSPCEVLSYAAMNSGIPESMFPKNSTMIIEKGRVFVEFGNGLDSGEIYSDKVPPQPC